MVRFGGSDGSVTITGANGAGTSNITVGNAYSATYMGVGTNGLLLAGHTATVSAGTVLIAQRNGSISATQPVAQVTFDTGSFRRTASSLPPISGRDEHFYHAQRELRSGDQSRQHRRAHGQYRLQPGPEHQPHPHRHRYRRVHHQWRHRDPQHRPQGRPAPAEPATPR
ncbi:MAG: hypothetical protein U1F77_13660 [Kiritimatiellia bacterium]